MGILRRLREWREDKDGTLIGPNIDADSVDAGSVNTDSVKIAGKKNPYQISGESLLNSESVTTSNTSYTIVSEQVGYYPPPDEFDFGDFSPYVRLLAEFRSNATNENAFIRLGYQNLTDGFNEIPATERDRNSTNYGIIDTGWINLQNAVQTTSEPITFAAELKHETGNFPAEVRYAGLAIAPKIP